MAIIIYRAAVNADHVGNTNVRIKHRREERGTRGRGGGGGGGGMKAKMERASKRRLLCLKERDEERRTGGQSVSQLVGRRQSE